MYYLTHYTQSADNRGYRGYRILPKYSSGALNILPENPARPSDYVLAAAYTHDMVPGQRDAMYDASMANEFPGQHSFVEY